MECLAGLYCTDDLWRDDMDEMAEAINEYVLDSLGAVEDYGSLNSERSEVESGYWYETEELDFDFSLAGPVNSNPDVLSGSSRKAVFQVEGDWSDIRQNLQENIDASIVEKDVGDLTVYELKFSAPF